MSHLNKFLFTLFLGLSIVLTSCSSSKEDDPEPNGTTDLEIVVVNELGERQSGATVNLYKTYNDFLYSTNSLGEKSTESNGRVVYKNLSTISYYIEIRKGNLDNYGTTYKTPAPLTSRETTTLTILVN